jgi:hypothetical protein
MKNFNFDFPYPVEKYSRFCQKITAKMAENTVLEQKGVKVGVLGWGRVGISI